VIIFAYRFLATIDQTISNHIKPLKLLIARVLIAFGLTAASPAFAASRVETASHCPILPGPEAGAGGRV
jgi:hypothetical protein